MARPTCSAACCSAAGAAERGGRRRAAGEAGPTHPGSIVLLSSARLLTPKWRAAQRALWGCGHPRAGMVASAAACPAL